jgi:glutamate dehydrogenase
VTVPSEQTKRELIEGLVGRVQRRTDEPRGADLEPFLSGLYADCSPRDLAELSPDDLYGAALALWRFGQKRRPGETKVRVYNPRIDESGWQCGHSVVEIVNDDMPFLIDSVIAELNRLDIEAVMLVHPIFTVTRDGDGRLLEIGKNGGRELRESFAQIQVSEQPPERHVEIRECLERVLGDVRVAVADWEPMLTRAQAIIEGLRESPPAVPADEVDETVALLEWMCNGRYTFLGYRRYLFERDDGELKVSLDPESGLGLLRDKEVRVFGGLRGADLTDEQSAYLRQRKLLRMTQTLRRSTVHRAVSFDTIAVRSFDDDGKVVGAQLFVGLFTSEAFSDSPKVIPGLRRRVAQVMARSELAEGSHSARQLQHVLDSFPRTELFQTEEDELMRIATGILHLQDRQRTALFVRRDPFERFVSCLVYLPRERYDTANRLRISKILERAFRGEIDRFYTHVTDSPLARLHFIVQTPARDGYAPPTEEVEASLVEAVRSWEDRLIEALVEEHGEARGMVLARRYGESFPAGYSNRYAEKMAVLDIARMEEAIAEGLSMNLYRPVESEQHELNFKIYLAGERTPLSDVLPMLENMGLRVIDERLFEVDPAHYDQAVWIRDLTMVTEDREPISLAEVRASFHEIFGRIWSGEMESDSLNKLVVRGGLQPREVTVIRAYSKYLRQARISFSQGYMRETLGNHPDVARSLMDLFLMLFDPEADDQVETRAAELTKSIERRLEEVTSLDEDRILRRFLNAILSTLRTNYFQNGAEGQPKPYLAMKIDSQAIEELPLPKPYREIHVHSPRMEAIHLRGGPVARGGIRWSDRREDFRTEILGLMKAQMVKNSVIVPVGSKGGFVVRRPPEEREALGEEVRECYRILISGLLDLTDNLDGDDVVPPPRVRRRDGDDPYLVVAADKGTATFSDTANAISADYGFWLDDAFASGGSAGYDHKGMGITARGGWESVKRHFRELGTDIQQEDFTAVGVGDMSGDVFGNGMLLSRHTKLVAAFNHLHIFIDPDPDPEVSWKERKRLFDLPRSSWADYDESLISAGGGVIDRKAKSVETTPEMRELLGIEEEKVRPNHLIRTILQARVDLLWFGGIGTYLKARTETHADADDRANDALRVNADRVKAKVVGEGANLGVTQLGRIELGLAGCRLNTDSIDNSAGVDTSDHEVNIKILLRGIEEAGDMTRKQRDRLLVEMTDEVGGLVLRDNYLQTQAITVTHQLGAHLNDRHGRFIRELEKAGRLDREIERLPEDDILAERSSHGLGFTRPELAVLLSYAKLSLYDELLLSDVPDDPHMTEELKRYFPTAIQERFEGAIPEHRLRREIVATVLTNSIVNRVGVTFCHEVCERTGMPMPDVARAFVVSREVFRLREIWADIESLDNQVPASLQATMLAECGRTLERATVWFLRLPEGLEDIGARIDEYRDGVTEITNSLNELTTETEAELIQERASSFHELGAPLEPAHRVAQLQSLAAACDIVRLARAGEWPGRPVAEIYFAIGARFGFNWLRRAALRLPADSAWDKLAVNAIVDDLYGHQTELVRNVLESAGSSELEVSDIEVWAEDRRPLVIRTEQLIAELQSIANPSLAMLAVANRQLKSISS